LKGRLFGRVDADPEADWDVEPVGGGQYETVLAGVYWKLLFSPQAYACNVCRLFLNGPEELGESGLPASRYEIAPEDLSEDNYTRLVESLAYDDTSW
jgi:hypothetical protein